MLLEIKALLQERGRMSLRDLAIHFHTDPQALEPMLDELCRQGAARRVESDKPGPCATCPGCSRVVEGMPCLYEPVRG